MIIQLIIIWFTATVWCYCMLLLLLYAATVCCFCMLPLYAATVFYWDCILNNAQVSTAKVQKSKW